MLDAVSVFNNYRSFIRCNRTALLLGSDDPAIWQVSGKEGALDAARAAQLVDSALVIVSIMNRQEMSKLIIRMCQVESKFLQGN